MIDAPDGKRDFFVSFNQVDRAWATWIAWALEEAGYSVFFQDWDFTGNFILEMDKAHTQSRRTVAVLSPDYLASRFAAPEWAARFAQDATSEHDLLIPVRVRPCELKGLLAQIVYVDLVGCGEAVARDKLLKRIAGIRPKPDEPPLFPGEITHAAVVERPVYPVTKPSLAVQMGRAVGALLFLAVLSFVCTLGLAYADKLIINNGSLEGNSSKIFGGLYSVFFGSYAFFYASFTKFLAIMPVFLGILVTSLLFINQGDIYTASPASSYSPKGIRFINDTKFPIISLYISNVGLDDWEEDVLGSAVIEPGADALLNYDDDSGYCIYKIRVLFSNGDQRVEDANFCETSSIVVRTQP